MNEKRVKVLVVGGGSAALFAELCALVEGTRIDLEGGGEALVEPDGTHVTLIAGELGKLDTAVRITEDIRVPECASPTHCENRPWYRQHSRQRF